MKYKKSYIQLLVLFAAIFTSPIQSAEKRAKLWIDLYTGEPLTFNQLISDLEKSNVIYLGETHSIKRHHDLQLKIVNALIKKNKTVQTHLSWSL